MKEGPSCKRPFHLWQSPIWSFRTPLLGVVWEVGLEHFMHMCRMSQEGWGAYLKSFLRECNVRSLLLSPHSRGRNNIIFLNSLEEVELKWFDYVLKSHKQFFSLLELYFHFTPKSRTYLKLNVVFSTFLPTSHFFQLLFLFISPFCSFPISPSHFTR